jgi:hypothetical protein
MADTREMIQDACCLFDTLVERLDESFRQNPLSAIAIEDDVTSIIATGMRLYTHTRRIKIGLGIFDHTSWVHSYVVDIITNLMNEVPADEIDSRFCAAYVCVQKDVTPQEVYAFIDDLCLDTEIYGEHVAYMRTAVDEFSKH